MGSQNRIGSSSFVYSTKQLGSSTSMEDCGISDRDFYWFNSNAQTTVDAMMEAEVSASVDAVTSAVVSAVVEEEVASGISDNLVTEAHRQNSKDDPSDTSPIGTSKSLPKFLDQNTREDNCDKEDEDALLAVARVVEETCNQIARQNELDNSSSPSIQYHDARTHSSDPIPMDVDQSATNPIDNQSAAEQQLVENNREQEFQQQDASNLELISVTQASSDGTELALVAVSSDNHNEQTSKADKSIELDDDIEYVVENILDKKSDSNGLAKFLVKWENYPSDANSWEPVENLVDCEKVMTKYELKRAERLAKIYGPNVTERPPRGPGGGGATGPRERHKVYKVVDIMGLTLVNEEKYFLVSLADDMGSTFIRASLAHRLFPSKVIDFYMRHIKWKSSAARS